MTTFVSIISHQNTNDIIQGLRPAELLAEDTHIIITDNLPAPVLANYCSQHQISYLANNTPKGFGANHNQAFIYCRHQLNMVDSDWFVILNPDVLVQQDDIRHMTEILTKYRAKIGAPNLFKDHGFQQQEASVRSFPYPWNAAASFLFKRTSSTLNRTAIKHPCQVDWASGAFLMFKVELYAYLGGFDERYYLYYEDVDICWRAIKLAKEPVLYAPSVKAVHPGKYASHRLNGRFLLWHITSLLRFSWVRLKTYIHGPKYLERTPL